MTEIAATNAIYDLPKASTSNAINYAAMFWALAAGSCIVRILACFVVDLNLMESYGVVMARNLSLSYIDHPPLTWWLIGLVTHLFGSELPIVVRMPFIVLFVGSSWLLYRLTARLFGAQAALYAVFAFTFSPLFGLWVGALALTDGLTIFFVLASATCLAQIIFEPELSTRGAWIGWLGAGLCLGLALASKYTAILLVPGFLLFILTGGPDLRRWLLRPQPYVGLLAALIPLLPVFVWNAEHGWISFLYQGGRAGWGDGMHPDRAIRWIGAQVLYLQPLIFLAAVAVLFSGLRAGPRRRKSWFCICLAIVPLVFFPSVMLWSSHSLRGFHWGAIGWVMLFPIIGAAVARLAQNRLQLVKVWSVLVAGTFAVAVALLVSHAMTGWIAKASGLIGSSVFADKDPILVEWFDWTDLRQALQKRHIDPDRTFVAGTRWESCAKSAYALQNSFRVLCLAPQNVHFAYIADPASFKGQDALIVDLSWDLKRVEAVLGSEFDSIEEVAPIALTYFGRVIMPLRVYRGIRFHGGSRAGGGS